MVRKNYIDAEDWVIEYNCMTNCVHPIIVYTDELPKGKLGNCRYMTTQCTEDRYCAITISKKFRNCPYLFNSILWHEFCHAEYYLKTGDSDHHSEGFHKRQWRKPILAIGDYIAKFVNPFL